MPVAVEVKGLHEPTSRRVALDVMAASWASGATKATIGLRAGWV
jgi:hypothetical protein